MKKIFLLLFLGLIPLLCWAQQQNQEKPGYAILIKGNTNTVNKDKTLVFTCFSFEEYKNGQSVSEQEKLIKSYNIGDTSPGDPSKPVWFYDVDDDGDSIKTQITQVDFRNSFQDARPERCHSWFSGFSNLKTINYIGNLFTDSVKTMAYMFKGCKKLESLDLSSFETSNVKSMTAMFQDCISLKSLNLSNKFNTRYVQNMNSMFYNCKLTSLDLSNFDTSEVTDMAGMFAGCNKLTELDLSSFNTQNVTVMNGMFIGCQRLTSLNLGNKFNTRYVTKMGSMFNSCDSLTSLTFPKSFDMGKVANSTNKNNMFQNCNNLRYIDFYASDDTDAITSVDRSSGMFNGLPATTVIYLPHGSSEVTDATNVVYSYGGDATDLRCPVYYSSDATDIELPRSFKTNSAQYTRTMSNTYGSVILPYAFTTNDNIQAYVQDSEYPEMMYFKDTQTVPAHTPFAFKKLSDGTTADFTMTDTDDSFGITVEATRSTLPTETTWDGNAGAPYSDSSVAVNVDGWTSRGYYINQKLDDWSDTYYIAGDKFYKADGQITVKPHRVSFHNPSSHAAMYGIGSIPVYDDNDDTEEPEVADAIKAAETRRAVAGAQTVYDASGRQVSQPMKGLNIIRMSDGSMKKVIMK